MAGQLVRWNRRLRRWALASPVATGALVFSSLAFLVSIKSCMISQDAYQQTLLQFRQERQLVLQGTFVDPDPNGIDSCSSIRVTPISSEFKLQQGQAFLPPQIYPVVSALAPVDRRRFRPSCLALRPSPGCRALSRLCACAANAALPREHVGACGTCSAGSFGARRGRGNTASPIPCSSIQASVDIGP